MPLPYYLTALNLQAVATERTKKAPSKITNQNYFDNIILNDSLVIAKQQRKLQFVNEKLKKNNDKRNSLKDQKINVIIGNPPYYKSQNSQNHLNKRTDYSKLYTA